MPRRRAGRLPQTLTHIIIAKSMSTACILVLDFQGFLGGYWLPLSSSMRAEGKPANPSCEPNNIFYQPFQYPHTQATCLMESTLFIGGKWCRRNFLLRNISMLISKGKDRCTVAHAYWRRAVDYATKVYKHFRLIWNCSSRRISQ